MIDLCVLIRYELRKICAKRILWTAFAIVAVISVLILKSGVPANRKVYDDYNGLVWNSSNYDRISSLVDNSNDTGQEGKYHYIAQLEWYCDFKKINDNINFNDYVNYRNSMVNETYLDNQLTEKEIQYWNNKGESTYTPTLQYAGSYINLASDMFAFTAFFLLLTAFALSSCFSDEFIYRTDAITLCTKLGRHKIYIAKCCSAAIFTIIIGVVYALFLLLISGIIYGFEGFNAPVQVWCIDSMFPLTMGRFVIILFGLMLLSGLMNSSIVLLLSMVFRNSLPPLAVTFASMLFATVIQIKGGARIFKQLMSYLPVLRCGSISVVDERLVMGIDALKFSYILFSAILIISVIIGKLCYDCYQVKSR